MPGATPDGEQPAALVQRLDAEARRGASTGGMVWRQWGAGGAVVLLHGAHGSWTHWLRNVPALAARFRVLAPDMPGFGDSAPAPEPHTAEALAALVSEGLDAMVPPPERLDLAGFSFGGIVAGLVAARLGTRVRTLALVGPNGMALPREPLPALRRPTPAMTPAEITQLHRDNLAALMIADPRRVDDVAVHVQLENVRRTRFRVGDIPDSDVLLRALPAVRARVVGVWGDRDVYAAPYLAERRATLARWHPDLDFRVVEGAGHWAIYEAADCVNAVLLEILCGRAHPVDEQARPG
jgi:pimeloyl-ACP methyl ester carboxylesterase